MLYGIGSAISPRSLENIWLSGTKAKHPGGGVHRAERPQDQGADEVEPGENRGQSASRRGGASARRGLLCLTRRARSQRGRASRPIRAEVPRSAAQGQSMAHSQGVIYRFRGGPGRLRNLQREAPRETLIANSVIDPPHNHVLLAAKPGQTRKYDVCIVGRGGQARPYTLKAWEAQVSDAWHIDKTLPVRGDFDMLYSFDPSVIYVLEKWKANRSSRGCILKTRPARNWRRPPA